MIEQELVFLGLLQESPQHGYQIKKKIREILPLFSGLDIKSIYYPLSVLEKKGLLVKRSLRQGNRPKRYEYELTAQGKARFLELLDQSLLSFKRPQFTLDLSLYFLPYLSPDTVRRRLRGRMRLLQQLAASMKRMAEVSPAKGHRALGLILEHNFRMVEAERKFLAELTQSI
jgi:DNA-binding PadR family transcriptional regulator